MAGELLVINQAHQRLAAVVCAGEAKSGQSKVEAVDRHLRSIGASRRRQNEAALAPVLYQ